MSKKTKLIIGIIAALLIGSVVIIIGIATCGIFSAIAIPQFVKAKDKAEQVQQMQETTDDSDIYSAKVLKSTLEGSMLEYETIEGKMPEKFSDFVLLYGVLEKPYTYSFADLEDQIVKPSSPEELDTTKLEVSFKNGVEANYTLNPPQIEMTLKESNDQDMEINEDQIKEQDDQVNDQKEEEEYINTD